MRNFFSVAYICVIDVI